MINKIIIATGVYLQENKETNCQDIQNFIVKYFNEIRIPLKDVLNCLELLVVASFLEKVGDKYSMKNKKEEIAKTDEVPL